MAESSRVMMYTPITSTNQPKAGFSFSFGMRSLSKLPAMMPTMAMAEKIMRKFQSISSLPFRSPVKPMSDFAAMMMREVPTACFIGSFAKSTSAGIMRNPPPAPTSPVIVPTTAPSPSING